MDVYHEYQKQRLCGLHCINTVLQGSYFTQEELMEIAADIDRKEGKLLNQEGEVNLGESQNASSVGDFSIQVIEKAFNAYGLAVFNSNSAALRDSNPELEEAFIFHTNNHWFSIRKLENDWYLLDSVNPMPKYLPRDEFLSKLRTFDGQSFVVRGEFPKGPQPYAFEDWHTASSIKLHTKMKRNGWQSWRNESFMMFEYKVKYCTLPAHESSSLYWNICQYKHRGERNGRRSPHVYQPFPCRVLECFSESCKFAHGMYEIGFHPMKYRTRMCSRTPCTLKWECFFAHSLSEQRNKRGKDCSSYVSNQLEVGKHTEDGILTRVESGKDCNSHDLNQLGGRQLIEEGVLRRLEEGNDCKSYDPRQLGRRELIKDEILKRFESGSKFGVIGDRLQGQKESSIQASQGEIPSSSEPTGERSMIERQGDYQNNVVTDSTLVSSSSTVSVPADIITEILRRLPAKDIMRFKCVCKSWNSLAQEHSFISQHLENRPESKDLGIITLYWDGSEFSIRHFVNGYHKLDMTDLFKDKRYRLSNPCDGLVCACGTRTTYVMNPSIREVVILPETKNSSRASIALGKNISTGDYVLVRLFRRSFTRTGCEIFILGSHTWRVIQDAPCAIDYECVPVLLNGILHWLTGGHGIPEIAISFDVNVETFDVIMKPVGFGCLCYIDMVELNGHLCVLHRAEDDIQEYKDIWVLKDYGRQGWVRWRIMLQTEIFPLHLAYYMTPVMVRDGKMLWRTDRGRFDYYDTASRRFVETHYDPLKNVYCLRNICPYMESLVSPIAAIQEANLGLDGGLPAGISLKQESRGIWGRHLSYTSKRDWSNNRRGNRGFLNNPI